MNNAERKFDRSILQPLTFGALTGVISGTVITLFFVCAKIVSSFALSTYAAADTALAAVCVVILAVLCCLLTAVIQTLYSGARGSGIPLAEAAARGMVRFKWLSTAASLIAGSLLAFACGMPLGSEGPSVGVGASIGEGVGKIAKKPSGVRRYLITGGACAGLAVAFNAPLTGICFAFEETHRRFSPYITAAALSAVVVSLVTSQALLFGFGKLPYLDALGVHAGFTVLPFLKQTAFKSAPDAFKICGAAVILGCVCALFGAAFNRAINFLSKLCGRVKNAALRLLPVFAVTAVIGLCLPDMIGSGEALLEHSNVDTAVWFLVTALILRFALTAAASGSGATGGLFMPMLAIGGLIGALAAKTCVACGLSADYAPNITILCICAFFAASVRAPITAAALSIELTASFVSLLPCVIAISAATAVAELTRTEPLYEHMMESLRDAAPLPPSARNIVAKGTIEKSSPIAFKRVRNIMWPYNSLVTELVRNGEELVPDGETVLYPGDKIVIRAENVAPEYFYEQINEYIKPNV